MLPTSAQQFTANLGGESDEECLRAELFQAKLRIVELERRLNGESNDAHSASHHHEHVHPGCKRENVDKRKDSVKYLREFTGPQFEKLKMMNSSEDAWKKKLSSSSKEKLSPKEKLRNAFRRVQVTQLTRKGVTYDARTSKLVRVDERLTTMKGHITGLVDERDQKELLKELWEDGKRRTTEKNLVKSDRTTWTKKNLAKLEMKDLVTLELFTTEAYRSPLMMPVYLLKVDNHNMDPYHEYLFLEDKSEGTAGATGRKFLTI